MGRPFAVGEQIECSECSLSSAVDMTCCGSDHCCMTEGLDEEETAEGVGGCAEDAPVPVGSAVVGSFAVGHIAAAVVGHAAEIDLDF